MRQTILQTSDTLTNISYTSATATGTFVDFSGNTISSFGHCWSTSENPTIDNTISTVDGTPELGDFTSLLSGLTAGTQYYVRAYAVEDGAPVYSNQVEFSTPAYGTPMITTKAVTDITYHSAASGGNIESDGGRIITSRGVCWSTFEDPTIDDYISTDGTGDGSFDSEITGLDENTRYYIRAYATNSVGTGYGNQHSFTTDYMPSITITSPAVGDHWLGNEQKNITWTSSNLESHISIALYKDDVFIYDIETHTENDGAYTWESVLDGQNGSNYKIRIRSIEDTELYFESSAFTLSEAHGTTGTVHGYSYTYSTIKINKQWWMSENLNEYYYPDGVIIPAVTVREEWAALEGNNTDDAVCYYNNFISNTYTYGRLYTWAAAMGDNAVSSSANPSGVQGVCPDGWHLPSDAEWQELEIFLGMSPGDANLESWDRGTNQSSMLAGNAELWIDGALEEDEAFGSSGFDGLPGGFRYGDDGTFTGLNELAAWWTATQDSDEDDKSYYRLIWGTNTLVERGTMDKSAGMSVRCVKDLE